MSSIARGWRWLLIGGLIAFTPLAHAALWCAGYFPGWEQGAMAASNIDFSVVTHVIHFSLIPNANGTLDTNGNTITPAYTRDVVTRAHAAHRQALICVGGAGTSFQSAVGSLYLANFVTRLTNFMAVGNYDGIDVDWEPLNDSDNTLFTNFVVHLRAAMDGFGTHKLLTVAVGTGTTPSLLAAVQSQFDQINLMTYDLSGPWPGWVTWFNAPIYDEGLTFPSVPTEPVPSIEGAVSDFLAAGIATNKLGIGIPFYGYVWRGGAGTSTGGATQPYQSWTAAPAVTACAYRDILSSNFPARSYHYDFGAQASYFSITNAQAAGDMFVSYEDQRACQAKVSYARNRGLGGFIIWELSQDHQANQPGPLLQAIKQTLATPGQLELAIQGAGQTISLDFTSAPLGYYQVQTSSNLTAWSSALVTNVGLTSTGGLIQAPVPFTKSSNRFYRIKTPP
jgi:chitinase